MRCSAHPDFDQLCSRGPGFWAQNAVFNLTVVLHVPPATSTAFFFDMVGQIVLLGDSNTQFSWMPGGTAAALADRYQRQ